VKLFCVGFRIFGDVEAGIQWNNDKQLKQTKVRVDVKLSLNLAFVTDRRRLKHLQGEEDLVINIERKEKTKVELNPSLTPSEGLRSSLEWTLIEGMKDKEQIL